MAKTKPISEGLAKAFGERVRALRIANTGLSQEQFADHIKVHRTFISRIERGETNITLSTIVRICSALGITLSDFFRDFETSIPSQTNEK